MSRFTVKANQYLPLMLVLGVIINPSYGQLRSDSERAHGESIDHQLLVAIYEIDNPVFGAIMFGADAAAYPAFYGAVPMAWAGAALFGDSGEYGDAYLLTLSMAGSYLSSTYLKKVFRRPRPSIADRDPRGRERHADVTENRKYEFAFPSGHSAIAFGLVTSYSLSHPRWYVVAPGLSWAAATAVSRVWRGRHYPLDILGGAVLGAAIAGGLHLAGPYITPDFLLADEEDTVLTPPVTLQFRF